MIGIAARPLFENLIAGVQLALAQPIRIDDVVIVEGEYGHVEEIASTFVVVRIWDQRRMVLPLTYFIEKPFQNWTRTGSALLGTVFLYVDYTVSVDAVRREVPKILETEPKWDGAVQGLQVTDAKEATVELRILVSARNSADLFDLRCNVRERLIAFLHQSHPNALPTSRQIAVVPVPTPQAPTAAPALPASPEPTVPPATAPSQAGGEPPGGVSAGLPTASSTGG